MYAIGWCSCSEDSSSLARSFLTLLIWVYDFILRAIQGLTGDPKAAQIGSAHEVSSCQTLVEKSCEVVSLLADCRSVCALVHIALSDSPGKRLITNEIKITKNAIAEFFAFFASVITLSFFIFFLHFPNIFLVFAICGGFRWPFIAKHTRQEELFEHEHCLFKDHTSELSLTFIFINHALK